MTVSVVGTNNETVVFQTRKVKGSDLETDATLLDLDDIPMPSGVLDSNNQTYANFSALYADLPTNQNIRGPQGPQGPAIDSVSLEQSVDLSTVTMTFGYTLNNQGYTVGTTPSFTIPAGPTGQTGTGIQFVSHDTQNHTLTFQFTDTLSDLTVDLPQGDTGPAGRSISSISKSGDVLTINYDDGSSPTQISGIRGPAGDAATITVSATNTLAAGASATVTETGTSNSQNRELIFGIPAGADGVDGVDGNDGVSVTGVNQVNASTINFSLSDSTTTSNITLPSATASSILPSYTNNAGKVLAVNSTANDIEWIAGSGTGTVTSVGLTGANGITFSGSPITTSGTISTSVDAATLKSHLAIDWADVANKPSIPIVGTDAQAYDAGLTDIAALAVTDGNFIVGDGANWVVKSGATARTSLGLGTVAITDSDAYASAAQGELADSAVQPNDLATTLNTSATNVLLGRSTAGAGAVEEITLTSAGRALLDDADAPAQRTTLGLGSAATSNTSAFESAGSVSTHAAATSSVHGISAFGATLVDDADAPAARATLGLGSAATTAATNYATAAQGTLASTALQDVVDDSAPQLGGSLDVATFSIVSSSARDINITPDSTGNVVLGNFSFDADQTVGLSEDNYILTYNNSTGLISLEVASVTESQISDFGSYQPADQALTDISGLAVTDGNIIVGSGTAWVAESGATARASLGLTIGTDVQAYDANTAKYNDTTANFTGTLQNGGSDVLVATDIGSSVQAAGSYLTSVDLASDVGSTVLPVANGGTGLTTLGSAGQVLKVNSAGTALEYATDNTGAASGADPVVMAIALG
jgi:hypothetical protein